MKTKKSIALLLCLLLTWQATITLLIECTVLSARERDQVSFVPGSTSQLVSSAADKPVMLKLSLASHAQPRSFFQSLTLLLLDMLELNA